MQRERFRLRPLVGLVILGALVWRIGAGVFVDAVRHVDARSLAAAAAIAVVTTVCGAWRWVLVARGLGADLSLRSAVAACYRSQFLNVTLPGGVLGDVHRGVRHGRDGGDLGRGLRSVVWERSAGQVVLLVLTLGAVLVLPSHVSFLPSPVSSLPARPSLPEVESAFPTGLLVAAALAGAAALGGLVVWMRSAPGRPVPVPVARVARVVRAARADVRAGLLGRHTWPGVVAVSTLVVIGHVATFVLAARSAGVTAPVPDLVPLALVVLVAMAVPLNVAGWGPREGVAAWAFGVSGLGVAGGVGTAVAYGVMAFVAALPGAALLLVARRTRPGPALATEGAVGG